jgi:DNA-binding MarR family transcriptional regulator
MIINSFFKPTILYKEFMILDMISKQPDITQRDIGETIGIAVSMVNNYLDEYEKNDYIKREYQSLKTVNYRLTKKGHQRIQLLNIWYLESSNDIYESAKSNIVIFIKKIIEKGFKRIILYGAGEVAETLLQVIQNDHKIPISIVALIDDDPKKQGLMIGNTPILKIEDVDLVEHDGILISSYTNSNLIYLKLDASNYDKKKIIKFFDF